MNFRYPITLALVLAAVIFAACASDAAATDPHELYERRCGDCHTPHAGQFVQESIGRADGKLVGQSSGRAVEAFLSAGHGKLSPAEIEVMMSHLTAILDAGALFKDNCVICHGRAVVFARGHLGMKDGLLVGRYSGREVEEFLTGHGRLEEPEIRIIVEALSKQVSGDQYRLN